MSFSGVRDGRSNSMTSFVCHRGLWSWKRRPSAERSKGQLDSPVWTQRTAGGVELGWVDNPVLQNEAHVSALEGFLGDLRVPICGYVVSAGRARFAPEIADAVVSVRHLWWVLSIPFAEPSPRVLDAAWRRLEGEAAKSPGRRAAHEAYARQRRDAFRVRPQG